MLWWELTGPTLLVTVQIQSRLRPLLQCKGNCFFLKQQGNYKKSANSIVIATDFAVQSILLSMYNLYVLSQRTSHTSFLLLLFFEFEFIATTSIYPELHKQFFSRIFVTFPAVVVYKGNETK